MFDSMLVLEILSQIEGAAKRVARRSAKVDSADAFIESEAGLEKLDAICMQLIAIGESLKNLDKVTEGNLLPEYPQVEWKGAMGIRDVITHHYFDLDAEAVYDVCEQDIPVLIETISQMKTNLLAQNDDNE